MNGNSGAAMKPKVPQAVAIYTRKSSEANSKQAKSHERQTSEINQFCKSNGMVVVREFSDTMSAFNQPASERSGFMSMIKWLDENASHICIMTEVSRLSRHLSVWNHIQHNLKQLRFVELGNNEPTELMLSIYLTQAREESRKIGNRVKSAYQLKVEQHGEKNFAWGNPEIQKHSQKATEVLKESVRAWWEPILIMDAHLYKLMGLNQSQRVEQLNKMGQTTRPRMVKGREIKGKPITAQNLCRAHNRLGTGGVKEFSRKVVEK